jgi:hypothetical protein
MTIVKLCQDETSASGYCGIVLKNNDTNKDKNSSMINPINNTGQQIFTDLMLLR